VPKIFNIIRTVAKKRPLVSIIVPVYNQASYLRARLNSIYSQTFFDTEIIILDDASTDNSYQVATGFQSMASTTIYKNEVNSGSPFIQWEKGIHIAQGDFIWIAEGDDVAESSFLSTLLTLFNQPNIGLVYCASHVLDQDDNIQEHQYLYNGHYQNLGYPIHTWQHDYVHNGIDEIKNALAIRNTIPNASAVVFRTEALKQIQFNEINRLQFTGDWFTYIAILMQGWDIAYCAKTLNYHRKHNDSVVARVKHTAQLTLGEYYRVHHFIATNMHVSGAVLERMISSVVVDLFPLWPNVAREELEKYYNLQAMNEILVKNDY
jgi:glycosyltransferase involved in cell wall biosynthesis